MIDFEVWFCQIVTTCELIASEDALPRTWVGEERTITSVIDFGELYEQIFGDLDSDACLIKFASTMDADARAAVERFLNLVKNLDSLVEGQPDLKDPARLLASAGWREIREAARSIIELPAARKCRSGREDIRI